jgi:hypothetical protein
MFWDFVLLRLHLGFGVVPGGLAWVTQAVENAYSPPWRRMFAVHPPGPAMPLPRLEAFSLWLLTQDSTRGPRVLHDAAGALQQQIDHLPPLGLDVGPFPGMLANARPVDPSPHLSLARKGSPPDTAAEASALSALGPHYRERMSAFRSRVRLEAPVNLLEEIEADFAQLWRQYWERDQSAADFPLDWFFHDVVGALADWPAPSSSFTWDSRPMWIDRHEWSFLRCCYEKLGRVDRLAIFLLLYGALNIRQIVTLFRLLHNRTHWHWSETQAGHERVMDHLLERWTAVVECMSLARRTRLTAN